MDTIHLKLIVFGFDAF